MEALVQLSGVTKRYDSGAASVDLPRRGEDEAMSEERHMQKMTEWAGLFLEPGETIRAAAWGRSRGFGYLLGVGSGRIAAVTERHLYVFESPRWGRRSRARGVVAKHPLGSVRPRLNGWALRMGDERVAISLQHRGRARRVVGLAAEGSGTGSMPPAGRRAAGAALLTCLAVVAAACSAGPAGHPSATAAGGPAGGSGRVLHVGRWPGLHGTYRTIQAAVNAARPGDRILIAAGDYHESPGSAAGVRVTTPGIVIEGVDRNTVIVDGTKPGAPSPCDPQPRFQDFGPVSTHANGRGRNGIVIDHVSGVTVANLTVCNFVGASNTDEYGNQLWFNEGAGTGRTRRGAYHVADITATSTYIAASAGPHQVAMAARTGVLISNAAGPGTVINSFASNMADSGFHIAGCPDCNATFDRDTADHNVIGFSATDAGGRLLLENSVFEHNGAGVSLASENNQDAPPPQDGACPPGASGPQPIAPRICTVIEHNTVQANNNADVSPAATTVLLGAGIGIGGGQHDLVFHNDVSGQGSYGIVTTPDVNARDRFPNAHCQGGRAFPPFGCAFTASGNVIAENALRHNGTFHNPTNGDLAGATVPGSAPNCYRGNADRSGRLTSAPHGLQAAHGCAAPRGGTLLGVELLCAARGVLADCHGGTGNAALSPLAALSHLLRASFDAAAVLNTRAIYPTPGNYVAPRPAPQPSLHP